MKKSLLFMAFLFILGGLCVNAADVVDAIDNPTKSESYGDKTFVGASETEYLFAQASPQSGFFQIRQSKSSYITNKTTFGKISSISFSLTQGSVKVYGGNTAYTSYTTSPAGVEIETVSSTGNNVVNFADEYDYFYIVPANTTIVKIADIKFTWSIADGPSEPVAYEPNFADVELWEGNSVTLDLGAKHPEVVFISNNESVATVSDEGIITGVSVGETTITAMWDATEEFLEGETEFKVSVVVAPEGFFDVLTIDKFSGATSSYKNVSYTSTVTGIKYEGNLMKSDSSNGECIQLRWTLDDKNPTDYTKCAGIFNTENPNGLVLASVAIEWFSTTKNDNIINVYSADKALSIADMSKAEIVEKFTKDASCKSAHDFVAPAAYFGLRSNKNAHYIKSITLFWVKAETPDIEFPSFGEAEHSFTTESSEIRIADADHAFDIFYLHTPAPAVEAYAEGDADNFENKAEFDDANGEHVIPVSESGTLSYYAVHTATGTQGATETVKVTKTATTAIDAIGADAAEGEAEYFDIRGVKVNIDNAAPGLYIRRQGTTATKVIVK